MAEERVRNIIEYERLTGIRLKSSIFFGALRDPSEDLEAEIRSFLTGCRPYFNQQVENTFELSEGKYTKFEFFWTPQRARRVTNVGDKVGNQKVIFRSDADVNLLYLKERSLIIFGTAYKFAITEPGCGGRGAIYMSGGKNFTLEEIYFNKISTVGAYHEEELYNVINSGCLRENSSRFNVAKDGFVIRAGEPFRIVASKTYAQELRDARNMINGKISGAN